MTIWEEEIPIQAQNGPIRIIIPIKDWHQPLANAIREALPRDVIVVHSEALKELALNQAKRMGTEITIEVNPDEVKDVLSAEIEDGPTQ